jgi:mannose-1-phosphate guanylyltransferase
MIAVIMCGGSGTRLWPISRKSSPKQFIPLFNNKSLFQLTIERNKDLVDEFLIVVNDKQLTLCQKQIPADIKVKFIIEPVGRNTAPAICLAAHLAPNDDLLILASDHLIKNQEGYIQSVKQAKDLSQVSNLVTFGIKPVYPETGYGYIEADGFDVRSFKEKPNFETAQEYISQQNFFWNSGMFLFNARTYLSELEKYSPKTYSTAKDALTKAHTDKNIYTIALNDMMKIPADSIDYAVMEKSKCVKVVPSDFDWSDLGSFDSLHQELKKDDAENTIDDNYIQINSHNNLILSQKRIISTININDLIIVDTKDALLIMKKGESQKVKTLLEKIKEKKPELLD